jgi:hypothetical protein
MNNYTTLKHFRFIAFMLMISNFLPLIFFNLPPIIGSHHVWTIAWFASLLVFKFKILQQNLFGLVLVYGLVMILILLNTLWIDVDEWNKNQIIQEFYEITVAISVIVYFRMEGDYVGLANLVKWTMVFILITAIMSVITSFINPMYARDIIGVAEASNEQIREQILSYQKYGGGNYSFASGIVCLLPLLMYYFKHNSSSFYSKKYLVLIIIMFSIALLAMQIFANILIAAVIIAFSIAGTKNAKRGFAIVGTITAISFMIPVQVYVDLFQSLASWFSPHSDIYSKFNETAIFFATGGSYEETGIGGRAARYPMLWESFRANPLFGHYLSSLKYKDITLGAHLFWMNKLGVFGLLGTIPFAFIIYRFIKINLRYFDKEFAFYFLLSVFSIIGLGAMKTLIGRELWYTFFILVPGFYYLPLLKKKSRER